jgi:Eco29kI-like restriction endonuclease
MTEQPYNPLDRKHLGESVAGALLIQEVMPLPLPDRGHRNVQAIGLQPFLGAGIYVIYYIGDFPLYRPISERNKGMEKPFSAPIYVGKADPKGSRTGIYDASLKDKPLYDRLRQHSRSIEQARNLRLEDFRCRYLVVEDIWIPLGENLLINEFKPLWNMNIFSGFGIHQPGSGRAKQKTSIWDTVHPGRREAYGLPSNDQTLAQIEASIVAYLKGDTKLLADVEPES